MSSRIHLVIDDRERDAFRSRASAEGLSLSEWMRESARDRLERSSPTSIRNVDDLDRFFVERAAAESGIEPDWDEHVRVADRSRLAGLEPS